MCCESKKIAVATWGETGPISSDWVKKIAQVYLLFLLIFFLSAAHLTNRLPYCHEAVLIFSNEVFGFNETNFFVISAALSR